MNRKFQWKLLDNFKRKLFLKQQLKNILLKSFLVNKNLPLSYRYLAFFEKIKIKRWAKIIQQRNRCIVTGRVHNVLRNTKYSRFVFRSESYAGNLPGFRRASW